MFFKKKPLTLLGHHIRLELLSLAHMKECLKLRQKNQSFFAPWEPKRPPLTRRTFKIMCSEFQILAHNKKQYSFVIFNNHTNEIMGNITLSQITYGVAQSAMLGYGLGQEFTQKGYMTQAVYLILEFAFLHLHLHRVEASCMPRNTPSIKLLEKTGFEYEGFSKKYLKIAGSWEDHKRYALLVREHQSTPDFKILGKL